MSHQLINSELVSELNSLSLPESNEIDIQVTFWKSEGLPLPYQNGSELHPDEGGSPQGTCHILGTYQGPLPTNEEALNLVEALKGKSKKQKEEVLKSQLELLKVYYPEDDLILPILKGSTLSFFSTWEDYQTLSKVLEQLQVNSITVRVTVPSVCKVFQGQVRDDSYTPLFSGVLYDVDFTNLPSTNFAEWKASSTITFPVLVDEELLNTPQLRYQKECIQAQSTRGAMPGYRNKVLTNNKSTLPYYLSTGAVSKTLDTSSMSLDPLKASLSK